MVVTEQDASSDSAESALLRLPYRGTQGSAALPSCEPLVNWMPCTELFDQPTQPAGFGLALNGMALDQVRPWSVLLTSQKRPSVSA